MGHGDGNSPFQTLNTSKNFHLVGYSYAFLCWGVFAIYCIMYQIDRFLLYRARRQRIASGGNIQAKPFSTFSIFAPLAPIGNYCIKIPFVTSLIPIKHCVGVFVFIVINLIWMLFAPFAISEGQTFSVQSIGLMDRRAAYVGMVNWSIVFVLGSRNTIITRMSGMTFEGLIPFHRWLARIGFAEFVPHFVWRIIHGYQHEYIVKDALFRNMEQGTGTIAMIGFLLLFVTSFEFIRRNYFEVFYYSHIVGIIIAIIASCWHEAGCFYYFIPTVLLWFFDRCWRSYQSWFTPTKLVQVDPVAGNPSTASKAPEGITRVLFEYERLKHYQPGQYFFLTLVNKTRNRFWNYANWHPMTLSEVFPARDDPLTTKDNGDAQLNEKIAVEDAVAVGGGGDKKAHDDAGSTGNSSGSGGSSFVSNLRRRNMHEDMGSFHMKALGGYTRDLLLESAGNEEFEFRMDGPYGPRLEYQDYKVMALFAAGIGVTPALTLVKDCVERRAAGVHTVITEKVHLVWALRTIDELDAFADQIVYWTEQCRHAAEPLELDIDLYLTRPPEDKSTHHHWLQDLSGVRVTFGSRPDIPLCIEHIAANANGSKVWLHTCGSDDFMRDILNEGIKRQWSTHRETFEF